MKVMRKSLPRIFFASVFMAACFVVAPLWACPIPVYQYSLEWWEQDAYEVYVFSTGELTDTQQALIDRLDIISRSGDDANPANLRLRRVHPDSEERVYAHSALRGERPETLPWMVVFYPSVSANPRTPVWAGALTEDNVDALLDSPFRQQLCEQLLERCSVVWVLLESGDTRADNEAAALLARELGRLQETLTIPNLSQWGAEDIEIAPIRFAIMRLSRNDAAERMLRAMLMNVESDLEDYADQPMVFPIFGRGLIMEPLIGRGINPYMIRRAAEFLTGPCSCTVKSLNPGVDILTNVDWAERIEPLSVEATTAPGSLGGFLDSADSMDDAERE